MKLKFKTILELNKSTKMSFKWFYRLNLELNSIQNSNNISKQLHQTNSIK